MERVRAVDPGGKGCSEVAPDGQRTRILFGGEESEYPKKHDAVDWL
jgi:hypothetical protein